jgi:hypothetical protein
MFVEDADGKRAVSVRYGGDERRTAMDLKRLSEKAKELVDRRGGTGALKDDADELKRIAQREGSLADKAKAAAEALKDPGAEASQADGNAAATPAGAASAQTEAARAGQKTEGEARGKHGDGKHRGRGQGKHRGGGARGGRRGRNRL